MFVLVVLVGCLVLSVNMIGIRWGVLLGVLVVSCVMGDWVNLSFGLNFFMVLVYV